jgi:hypothetical protein
MVYKGYFGGVCWNLCLTAFVASEGAEQIDWWQSFLPKRGETQLFGMAN